jgi:hypothetical protein
MARLTMAFSDLSQNQRFSIVELTRESLGGPVKLKTASSRFILFDYLSTHLFISQMNWDNVLLPKRMRTL